MAITKFLDPSSMPARTQDQQTFDNNMAGFMQDLPVALQQINATEASMNISAAGGANKVPYKVDLGTTMADPTAGWLRLNSATQNAATAIVTDVVGSDNIDYTNLLNTFDDSTSTTSLGQIRIEKAGDASKFLVFSLTAMTTPAGYRQFTVACVAFSAASPFAQADQVVLSFQRTGDKGDTGSAATFPILYVREEQPSGTASSSAGAFGVVQCVLNTVKVNEISGASLASNQVTLPAGTYEYEGTTVAYGSALTHKAMLYSVTDTAYTDYGTSSSSNSSSSDTSRAILRGKFTIATPKVFQLRRYTTGSSAGPAQPASASATEVYFEILFKKVG
jgi:hypothetical protein